MKAVWRGSLVTSDSHCNYHTNSSVSRATVCLEVSAPADDNNGRKGSVVHRANGQSKGKRCSNGEAAGEAEIPLKILETTDI